MTARVATRRRAYSGGGRLFRQRRVRIGAVSFLGIRNSDRRIGWLRIESQEPIAQLR